MSDFARTEEILKEGVASGALPGISYAVGRGDEVYLKGALGYRQINPTPLKNEESTLFDLASLSKLTATTMVALKMMEEGRLGLFDELPTFFDHCGNYGGVTVKQLMNHTSGLTPHVALDKYSPSPEKAVETILDTKPLCAPGEEVYYSCMGYITLGKILEKIGGAPLDVLAKKYVFDPLGMKTACYNPTAENVATTEFCEYRGEGHYIKGQVHDGNAWYLGGVSGNAGVFASIDDMIAFASMLSKRGKTKDGVYLNPRTFSLAVTNYTPGLREARGLGFQLKGDRYFPGGGMMSEGSYGHTGFTGTSLFVDAETGVYGIFLSNSVHLGRNNREESYRIRRMFFGSLVNEYFRK